MLNECYNNNSINLMKINDLVEILLKVSTFVTAFHESVFLYALALNETIAEGFSSRDGNLITRKMWNRTYSGKCIPTIPICLSFPLLY